MFLVKLKTAINFSLIIETCQILYQFGIELNFLCVPVENKQDMSVTSITLP